MKCCSLADLGFHPDSSAMPLYNPLADCEADATTGLFPTMKALEHTEDAVSMLRVNTNTVVCN